MNILLATYSIDTEDSFPGRRSRRDKWPRRESDYSSLSSTEDKNEWSNTSTPQICLQSVYRFKFDYHSSILRYWRSTLISHKSVTMLCSVITDVSEADGAIPPLPKYVFRACIGSNLTIVRVLFDTDEVFQYPIKVSPCSGSVTTDVSEAHTAAILFQTNQTRKWIFTSTITQTLWCFWPNFHQIVKADIINLTLYMFCASD